MVQVPLKTIPHTVLRDKQNINIMNLTETLNLNAWEKKRTINPIQAQMAVLF